jgi:outer membrane protein assembly factor BamB
MRNPVMGAALCVLAAASGIPGAPGARADGNAAPGVLPVEFEIPDLGMTEGPASFITPGNLQGFVVRVAEMSPQDSPTPLPAGIGDVFSSVPTPAVEGRRVFAGAGLDMRAFDAVYGRPLWTTAVSDSMPTAPAVRDGRVYFNTESCTLYSLDAVTGKLQWSRWIASDVATTPAVSAEGVFVSGPDGRRGRGFKLEAYTADRGKPVFRHALPADLFTAPVPAGDRVFYARTDGVVAAMDLKGKVLWETKAAALAAPWPEGRRIFVASGDGVREPRLLVLDAATGKPLRGGTPTPSDGGGDPPGGTGKNGGSSLPFFPHGFTGRPFLGGAPSFGFEGPRPCVAGETVAMNDGWHLLLATRDGEVSRRVDLGAGAAGCPVAAGGLFLQATTTGRLIGVDAATGVVKFDLRLFRGGRPLALSSSPAVSRGRAYLGTCEGTLVALDLPDASADGWPMWGGGPARSK